MKRATTSLLLLLSLLIIPMLATLTSCHRGSESDGKRVLVIWPLNEADEFYRLAEPMLRDSLKAHGMNPELQFFGLDFYKPEQYEKECHHILDSLFSALDSIGSRPDLVITYGDELQWLITSSTGKYERQWPFLFFGTHYPNFRDSLSSHTNMTGFMDTVCLKQNLDMIDSLKLFRWNVIAQLDWRLFWGDNLLREDLTRQMDALELQDSSRYFNIMRLSRTRNEILDAIGKHKLIFLALTCQAPMSNWLDFSTGQGFSVDYIYSSANSATRGLQLKYCPYSYSKLSVNPVNSFFTTSPEHFLVNDSCIGGYFIPFECELSDMAGYAKQLLGGKKPSELPVRMHTGKDYYANWPALESLGMKLSEVPSYIHLRGVKWSDRSPLLCHAFHLVLFLLMMAFVMLIFKMCRKEYYRRRKLKGEHRAQAVEALRSRQVTDAILSNVTATLFTIQGEQIWVKRSGLFANRNDFRCTLDEVKKFVLPFYSEDFAAFLRNNEPGIRSMDIEGFNMKGDRHWMQAYIKVTGEGKDLRKTGVLSLRDKAKEIAAELQNAHMRALNARERDNFIQMISHEIRTPLNSIVGFSELLCDADVELTEEDVQTFYATIDKNTDLLMRLIENILTLAHFKNAEVSLNLTTRRMDDVFDKLLNKFTPIVQKAGLHLEVRSVQSDVELTSDMSMLNEVIENLVSNAVKFNHSDGSVTLGWGVGENNFPYIFVADTGIGIPEEQMDLIYQRFYKIDSFTQGTGLGLSLVKELSLHLGYDIIAESKPGEGSKFTLQFNDRYEK